MDLEKLEPVLRAFENAVRNLKKSILGFERFEETIGDFQSKNSAENEVPLFKVQQKLFVDEFFGLEPPGQILPEELKHYDIKNMAKNDDLLRDLFQVPATILPLQNLGEIAYIIERPNAAFCLLDMCMKLYKHLDPENLTKFKALTLLGSILYRNGAFEACD